MGDNLEKKGNPDRSLISMGEDHEVAYWTKRFDVSKEDLQNAIDSAGSNSVAEVEKQLNGNKKSK